MSVMAWLEERAPTFAQLAEDERLAILHFSLLWSLFEANVMDANGNAQRIIDVSNVWAQRGLLRHNPFEGALHYFRNRYVENGEFTYHYPHLNLRPADRPDLVNQVLQSKTDNIGELVAGVLIIVYRYRNNLFHGEKWAYHIQGQRDNFAHANAVLMKAIDLHAGP